MALSLGYWQPYCREVCRTAVVLLKACDSGRRQDTVRVTKVKGHATEADVQQGRVQEEDRLAMRRLMLLPILVGVTSWNGLWILGVLCSLLGIPGIPLYNSCIGSWLMFLGGGMMGGAVLPLIHWFGIEVARRSSARLIFVSTLTLLLCLARIAS